MLHSLLFVFAVIAFVFFVIFAHEFINFRTNSMRERFIREAAFPKGLLFKLSKKYPNLTHKDTQLASTALRHYFLAYHTAQYQYLAMPSEVVDALWHEFILYTREYEQFCNKAFGRFFHHTPAVVLGQNQNSDVGLRRVWFNVCKIEFIDPKKPARLPLLFAIDGKLKIEDGRLYSLDCRNGRMPARSNTGASACVGDFSGSDGINCGGGSDGAGGGDSGGGDSGGCSGGCGGGGD